MSARPASGAAPGRPGAAPASDPQGRPGGRFLELVEVMDRLRSPGGCPWDAQQTHETLAPYVVEEAYELAEAIASGDRQHVAEELGDVLLQVVFHARVAQDDPVEPFDVDRVAGLIVDKLRRRHPHVFADVTVESAAQVETNWDAIKAAEKPERSGPLDGIPAGMPPLERAVKVVSRLERVGLTHHTTTAVAGDDIGARLLALVVEAREAGVDPAAALRATLAGLQDGLSPG